MKIDLSKKFGHLTAGQWEDKIWHRGVDHKYKKFLISLKDFYPNKIDFTESLLEDFRFFLNNPLTYKNLERFLRIFDLAKLQELDQSVLRASAENAAEMLNKKIIRLIDKFGAVTKEVDLRDKKQVKRILHSTIYYIDYNAGNDGAAGTAIGTAWLTTEKYTNVTVRTPGDIAKVRANTSEVETDIISVDEDGTVDLLITLKGCDSVDDPWSDGSNVRPILDFNDSSEYWTFLADDYWCLDGIEIRQGNDGTYGALYITNARYFKANNLKLYDNIRYGMELGTSNRGIDIIDCEFTENGINGIRCTGVHELYIKGCSFDGGGGISQNYGIWFTGYYQGRIRIIDCLFGQSVAHDNNDIYIDRGQILDMRNSILGGGITYDSSTPYPERSKEEVYEDYDQTFENHKLITYKATIERETTIVRGGGADTSAKVTPNSMVGLLQRTSITGGHNLMFGAFKVWLAASVQKTITVYVRGFGWTGFPTAPQLFLRASYLSNGASAARTEIDSNDVIVNNTTWVAFDVTLTPARDGFVYLDVFVAHYEAASGVYIDIKPVIS